MALQLKKATRQKVKLRLGLSAVSGGGKTYSSLLLAKGLCGDWDKIGVIDTENDSASLYSHLGEFNVISLRPPFSPERYVEAIKACEEGGMEVIIIDSIAHEWEGEGGVLDLCEKAGGGFQNGWKALTPRHEKFKQAILQSTSHVITTVRRKQEYALQDQVNKQGRTVQAPVKLGMKEVTREGWEYEVTLNLEIDIKHHASASKDRTGLFSTADPFTITEETGKKIREWCESGVEPVNEIEEAVKKLAFCDSVDELKLLRDTLEPNVISSEAFKAAAKDRYNSVNKLKTA